MKVKLLFRIEKVTPDRMPGADLAEYMAKLAKLLGAREHVHFTAIKSQSTGIEAEIGYGGRTAVRKRMRDASLGHEPEVRRHWEDINGMLGRKRLSAKLQEIVEDQAPVVRLVFPGAEGMAVSLPAIRDRVTVQGTLYRIEGRDRTAHAGLEDGDVRYSVAISREQARAIAPHMFTLLRAEGEALMTRTPDGTWEIGEISGTRIEPLRDVPLMETIEELHHLGGFGWIDEPNGLAAVQELRDDA